MVWSGRRILWAKFSALMVLRRSLVEIPFDSVLRRLSRRRLPLFLGCGDRGRLACSPPLSASTFTTYVGEGWSAAG